MKLSTKAACLSLFVFPGLGLLWLKQWSRGLLFSIPAAISLGYLASKIFHTVFSVRDKYQHLFESDPSLLSIENLLAVALKMYADVMSEISKQMATLQALEYFLIACWLCSALSSYFVGLQIERQTNETSQKENL